MKCFHLASPFFIAVNGVVLIKNLQGGTFALEHLYLHILDSHIPYDVFCG
jgi:hypothetical protein